MLVILKLGKIKVANTNKSLIMSLEKIKTLQNLIFSLLFDIQKYNTQ